MLGAKEASVGSLNAHEARWWRFCEAEIVYGMPVISAQGGLPPVHCPPPPQAEVLDLYTFLVLDAFAVLYNECCASGLLPPSLALQVHSLIPLNWHWWGTPSRQP